MAKIYDTRQEVLRGAGQFKPEFCFSPNARPEMALHLMKIAFIQMLRRGAPSAAASLLFYGHSASLLAAIYASYAN